MCSFEQLFDRNKSLGAPGKREHWFQRQFRCGLKSPLWTVTERRMTVQDWWLKKSSESRRYAGKTFKELDSLTHVYCRFLTLYLITKTWESLGIPCWFEIQTCFNQHFHIDYNELTKTPRLSPCNVRQTTEGKDFRKIFLGMRML